MQISTGALCDYKDLSHTLHMFILIFDSVSCIKGGTNGMRVPQCCGIDRLRSSNHACTLYRGIITTHLRPEVQA